MKKNKIILGLISALILITNVSCKKAEPLTKAPFTKGVNLTLWFEAWQPSIPNLKLYDKTDFERLKAMGVDVIRIPIHFDLFIGDSKTGQIKPIIFDYLDKACDWAEELGIYLIIDDHSFNSGAYPLSKYVEQHLQKTWPQIAKRYKKRSNFIMYEILNEPQIPQEDWYGIQQRTIDLIRSIDKKHTIVATAADWGSLAALTQMEPYADKNIIYTYHFYEPFLFTHQGASWTDKITASLKDIPFPYNKDRMPVFGKPVKGTGIEAQLKNLYPRSANAKGIKTSLQRAKDYSDKYNVPVWCGEMGVHNLVAPVVDRQVWYKTVADTMYELNIPFCVWGYHGSFGLFKKDSNSRYPNDLEKEVVEGVGFTMPALLEGDAAATAAFPITIFDDFGGKGVRINSWSCAMDSNCSKDKAEGDFSISMSDQKLYGALSLELDQVDFSGLNTLQDKAYLTMKMKFTQPEQKFQLRFVDNDAGNGIVIPWRYAVDMNSSDYELNKWVDIELPLNSFADIGGWSNSLNKWFDSTGTFEWDRVVTLEFAAETGDVPGEYLVDDIKIVLK